MFKKAAIKLGLYLIRTEFIERIPVIPFRDFLLKNFGIIKVSAEALTDQNPNNSAQIAEIWQRHKASLLDDSLETAATIVEARLKNKELAAMIAEALRDLAKEEQPQPKQAFAE